MSEVDRQREALLARYQLWRSWRPDPSALDAAARSAQAHGLRRWVGFTTPPLQLILPPPDWWPAILAAYDDVDQLNPVHFNDLCPPVRIELNPRLRTTAGRIRTDHRILELNAYRLQELPETRTETVFHELIHLWLYARGLPAGHNPLFRAKMAERGHATFRYGVEGDPKGQRHSYPGSDRWVVYRCPNCDQRYRRRRRFRRPMLCGPCLERGGGRHRLIYDGIISDQDEA